MTEEERSALRAFGFALRELRKDRGLSQEELADRCGLDRTYIGGIERGERNFSYLKLIRISKELSAKAEELLQNARI